MVKRLKVGVQDPRPPRDTSSERGDYMTAQESSITENDFNDIKFHSGGGPSSVLRKTRKKRRHHKSYKSNSRRRGSFERHRVCYVGNGVGIVTSNYINFVSTYHQISIRHQISITTNFNQNSQPRPLIVKSTMEV